VYPFDATTEMEGWVDDVLNGSGSKTADAKLDVIQQAMFDRGFDFEYAEGLTLTAAEAFEQRRGNCMSFTALFVALARSAGIDAYLLYVRRTPEVEKEDDLVVINHHVVAAHRSPRKVRVYDFYLTTAEPFIQQHVIDDVLATAMYHNNIAGHAIREGDLAHAERNLRITTTLAPNWPPGWVNLGVTRFRSGDSEGALSAYRKVLELDPTHPSALTNMAYLYRELGWEEEANTALRAAAHRSNNPFTLIALADVEMFRGDYGKAADYLRRARLWYRSERRRKAESNG
jgi:tetratricopeptide (TPR) repeat protein